MSRVLAAIRVLAIALAVALPLAWPTRALAQAFELSAAVDPSTLEIGTTFHYQLRTTISGQGSSASSPSPGQVPAGLTVVGTSSSSSRSAVLGPGGATESATLTTTWTVRADKLGTFTLGPATIEANGARRTARAVKVTVVAKGKAPRAPAPAPFDPFDFFNQGGQGGRPFDPLQDLLGDDDPRRRVPTDPKLALDQPRAPKAFLHMVVDKPRAVVGEQVTLSVYLYSLPEVQLGRATDIHVPSATDFTRRPLLDAATPKHLGRAQVGDRPWDVELVLRDALFPVKAGRLAVTPMSLVLSGSRVGFRESQPLAVDVEEPPVRGRPAGYALGDVGDFSLQATVSPRKVTQGEAVGVTLELRGTGNLPAQLTVPTAPGVEWMDAQVKEAIGVEHGERIGGTRTFTYVVRVDREGPVDLGEVRLPFFDPDKRAYGVARAAIGIVDVAKGATRASAPDAGRGEEEAPVLVDLPPPRGQLEGSPEVVHLTERRAYWPLVLGSPLACAAAIVLARGASRARERRRARSPDPAHVARTRRAEAEAALAKEDGGAAVAAIARALEALVLAETGVNARGAAGSALAKELEDKGVKAAVAADVVSALRACEDARFSPAGVSMQDARDLWKQVEGIAKALAEGAP